MISYGIGVLPLIRELRGSHPYVTQTWYAEDAGAGGKFTNILEHLRDLLAGGAGLGLLPEADQKHFGCGPGECSPGRGAL